MEVDENPLSKYTPEEIKGLFGAYYEDYLEGEELTIVSEREFPDLALPESFDSRDQWGDYVHEIRD